MRKLAWRRWVGPGVALLALAGATAHAQPASDRSESTPWLGVSTQELTEEIREGLDFRGQGVLVNRVVADSPADRAGIRRRDVITRLNQRPVPTPEELARLVRAARVGQTVSIELVRDGNRRRVSAKLGTWSDAEPRARAPRPPREPRIDPDVDAPRVGVWMERRGRLGVSVQDLRQGLGEYFGVPDDRGALVMEVIEDSPAQRAGIKAGDVITRVEDRSVKDADALIDALREREGAVSLTVVRKGASRTLRAELEPRERSWRAWRFDRGDEGEWRLDRDELDRMRREIRRAIPRGLGEDLREGLEEQIRELREQLRELRSKVERLERG